MCALITLHACGAARADRPVVGGCAGRWDAAFNTVAWPLLGLLFMPWTTLMFVTVGRMGTSSGSFDWFCLVLAAVIDVATLAGAGEGGRGRDRRLTSSEAGTARHSEVALPGRPLEHIPPRCNTWYVGYQEPNSITAQSRRRRTCMGHYRRSNRIHWPWR